MRLPLITKEIYTKMQWAFLNFEQFYEMEFRISVELGKYSLDEPL